MADLKTVGMKREGDPDIKDYKITHPDHTRFVFIAKSNGKGKFICPYVGVDQWSSIKDIKMAIMVFLENARDDSAGNADAVDGAIEEEGVKEVAAGIPTFNAVHPCALLIKYTLGQFGLILDDGTVMNPVIRASLDDFGYITPEGKADIALMNRELGK